MRHKILLCVCIILILIISIIAVAQSIDGEDNFLDDTRPSEALVKPEIPNEVFDIRVQVKERAYDVGQLDDYKVMQIYYGFYSDGKWHDYPCENYDLVGISDNFKKQGYEAAGDDHIIKIGNYILIAFSVMGFDDVEITDSLGSKVQEVTEYFSVNVTTETSGDTHYGVSRFGEKFAYLKENALALGENGYDYQLLGRFDKWYFIVLNESEVTEDYKLTFNRIDETGKIVQGYTRVLLYEDIQAALN